MDNRAIRGQVALVPSQAGTMTFCMAIEAILAGQTITKIEWDDPNIYGQLRNGILMLYRNDQWHQWILNDGDMLGTDWIIRTK